MRVVRKAIKKQIGLLAYDFVQTGLGLVGDDSGNLGVWFAEGFGRQIFIIEVMLVVVAVLPYVHNV